MINWTRIWERRRRPADTWLPVGSGVGGALVGAALAYWLDPGNGARRRATIRDKLRHAASKASGTAEACARDISHRSMGVFAAGRNRVTALGDRMHGRAVDDEILTQRVRSKLGRLCSHPRSIEVACREGLVELKGPILEAELERVLRGVSKVIGVRSIDNDLEPHAAPGDVAGLRGGVTRPARGPFQQHWSPAARSVAGATGAGLVAWGVAQRSLPGVGLGLVGLGLLLRGLTNLPTRRMVGIGAGRRAIDFEKDLHVEAPVSLIERGQTTGRDGRVTQEQLSPGFSGT
jgi:hypothetical protein